MVFKQLTCVLEEHLAPEIWMAIEGILSTYVLVIGVTSFVIYYYLFRPRFTKTALEDVGWFTEDGAKNRRQRKLGNIPPVYPNGWFAILDSDEVKVNQSKYVSLLGEDFAVFRTESGQVNVLNAICPHLGANLAIGGEVIGNCLECPFHRWQFSGETGECTYVPTVEKAPKTNVKKWLSYECNDLIYVWYHAENEEPTWYPTKYESIGKLSLQGVLKHEINGHIQDLVENTCDGAHFNALHEPSAFNGANLLTFRNGIQILKNWFQLKWEPSTNSKESHVANIYIQYQIVLFGIFKMNFKFIEIVSRMEGPATVFITLKSPLGTLIIISCIVPSGPLTCQTNHKIYCPFFLKPIVNLFVFPDVHKMIDRDIGIWHNKIYLDKPVLTKSRDDAVFVIYRRWFNQFYSKNSPTYEMAKNGLQW